MSDLLPGEGKVVELRDDKAAVYRDEEGHLHVLSAKCTHMGCIVHWNSAERSWDCPCHGTRFSTEGKVLEGPALTGLTRYKISGG
jgi:Rieske Fe-S protein